MEIEYPLPLPEKFEKTLKIKDEEAGGSDESMMIEEEDPYDINVIRKNSKQIVNDFLQQVQDNRFSEFPWPPGPDCAAYKYKYIRKYVGEVEVKKKPEIAKRFLDQVRTSWGYDVDCIPSGLGSYFRPIDMNSESDVEASSFLLKLATECVIDRINTEAKNMGKLFELVRINKAVLAGMVLYLLTLTIKDVEANAEKTIRAAVSMPPPLDDPQVVECKLISSVPT